MARTPRDAKDRRLGARAQRTRRRLLDATAALLEEHKALVARARAERAEALAQGQRDAERVKAEILDEARRQREDLLKQAQAQIDAGLRQARAELRASTADMAIQIAEKLLVKNLDDATQRRLVEEHLADLERRESGALPS